MLEATFIGIICVLMGLIAKEEKYRFCLKISFILTTILVGLRYMWGNDTVDYYYSFNSINSFLNVDVFDLDSINYRNGKEYGWIILNILCKPIGFLGLQLFLAIFENMVMYRLIKEYVPPKWYWLSLLIYCFSTSYLLMSATMLRQYLAMSIFLIASYFIIKKNIILYLLCVFIAFTIHKSALILLPFYFVGYFKYNLKKKDLFWIIPISFVWIYLGSNIAESSIDSLMSGDDFKDLSNYEDVQTIKRGGTGLGVIFNYVLLFTLLSQLPKFQKQERVLSYLTFSSVLFIPFITVIPMLGRLTMYFSIFSIFTYPVLMEKLSTSLKLRYFRNGLLICFIIILLKGYLAFFYSPVWHFSFYEYHSIFEQMY